MPPFTSGATMAKLTLSNVTNISGAESVALGVINANSDAIETALENTLSRDGTSPNSMAADLDMGNNDILNVDNIDVNTLTIDGVPVVPVDLVGGSRNGRLLFKYSYSDVAEFEADTYLSYSDVSVGDRIQIHIYAFEVAASGASDHHLTSTGGVKLYYRSAKSTAVASPVVGPDGSASFLAFGVKGNGTTDDTIRAQAAIATGHRHFIVPAGATILLSDTLREATNGGALHIQGQNKEHSILQASGSFPIGEPLVWVGNSGTHGVYRAEFDHLRIDGSDRAIGIRLHEASISLVTANKITRCVIGVDGPGTMGSSISDNEIQVCDFGIKMTRMVLGTASGPDDTEVTDAPLSLNTNINRILGNWISACDTGVHVEGGLCAIAFNTWQSNGTTSTDALVLKNANESNGYGGGPTVYQNWFEDSDTRCQIRLIGTQKASIDRNLLSVKVGCEQTIVGDSDSWYTKISGNSFIGHGLATPAEGRTQNAVIYMDGIGTLLEDNHYTSYPSRTYSQLVKLNRDVSAFNIVMERGQNGNTPMGVEFGNLAIGIGQTAQISPSLNAGSAFNSYIVGMQHYNCGAVVSAQTGTTFTLVLTNGSGIVTMNNASANTVTIPTNASVTYTIGTIIDIVQIGAGQTSVTGAVGVTVNGVSAGTVVGPGLYKSLRLIKTAANTWVAIAPEMNAPLSGTATYDPASLADGDGATTTVTVTGAALGDMAMASFSLDLQGITLTAWVSAADTVSVRFQNETGGVLDLASGTIKAWVVK
jgi:hypothetical protein